MPKWIDLYSREMDELGPTGMAAMLDAGRQWDLASVLTAGGVVVFPHAAPHECAHQTAAAVHACLDSGADKVLVIGVLHGWTPEMKDARERVAAGEDFTGHPLRGIHGPDMPHSRPEWQLDHSLITWRRLWHMECERRGVTGPAVCEVYPFLAGVDPTTLPHFDAVARWAEDAVIVATTDPFHHGIGYGDTPATARAPHDGGLDRAAASIVEGQRLLAARAYPAYLRHCLQARSDARDAGPLYRELCGPLDCEVLDLTASDMTAAYAAPPPTWVAAALLACRPA